MVLGAEQALGKLKGLGQFFSCIHATNILLGIYLYQVFC